ncbi:MAG TPA: ATP-binding cassette domain-containing protein [Gaiellaceae bacterium]|jgi:simple sugar transport system ATP-binding protein|nr:ATP-binding cassette domain-containing protein [Gaiellaceae bacterium]
MAAEATNGTPLVEGRGIAKRFGRIEALRNVSFSLGDAEVLGLLGDNGAGKSTLIKILTGLFPPDKGEILWDGEPVQFSSPRDAYDIGVATVYQDLAIVDLMAIYRNVFLGREKAVTKGIGPFRWIDRKKAHADARKAISDIGIEIRDAEEPIARLSGGERQSVAIARAAYFNPKLLILDEPTSALSLRQTGRVLKSVEEARNKGISIIFITHNVYHVYPIADRFVILSHGESIAEFPKGKHSRDEVAELIVTGKEHALKLGYGAAS